MSFQGLTNDQVREITRLQLNRIRAVQKANTTLNNKNMNNASAAASRVFAYVTRIASNFSPNQQRAVRTAAAQLVSQVTNATPMPLPIHNERNFTSGNARAPIYGGGGANPAAINRFIENAFRAGFNTGSKKNLKSLKFAVHPNRNPNKRNLATNFFQRLGQLESSGAFGSQ